MRLLLLSFIFLIASINTYSQADCYKRIVEEASKIDTLQASSGTGFLINNMGLIVTNRHVVEGALYLNVTFDINGKKVIKKAKVLGINNEVDLAILGIDDEKTEDLKDILKQPLPYGFSETPMKLGEKIYVLGFPSPDLLGTNIKLTDGIISATSGFMDDNEMYQISAPIQPGSSGSPMFDFNGNIKGIIVASYTNGQVVNYAIKSKFLKQMLNEYRVKPNNSKTLYVLEGPKQKYSGDFKSTINTVSKRICLIENVSRKTYYEEFKLQENTFHSKSTSVFGRYNGDCTDDKMEAILKNKVYERNLDKNDVEYLKNWAEKYFKDDFSRTLFYTLITNYDFSWNDFNYHYKLEYLDKIGASENIIQEHDFKYKLSSKKIDEYDFDAYVAGYFPYYFKAVLDIHERDYKKLRNLISYINLLIKLNDTVDFGEDKEGFHNSNKASLLLYKSRAMLALPNDFTPDEVCATIKFAKTVNPSIEIWVEYTCK